MANLFTVMFIYDFLGVFATSAIPKVAQSMPTYIPLKLMIPKISGFSMVGLGDLIIPGIACSFCLRIDLIRAYNSEPKLSVRGFKIP